MTGQMQPWVIPSLTLAASVTGSIFGGWLSKRGEIKAIHGQLDKVVAQNEAITRANEEIKSEISDRTWSRIVRKDACFDLLKQIPKINNALAAVIALNNEHTMAEANRAHIAYLEVETILAIVCTERLQPARISMTAAISRVIRATMQNDTERARRECAGLGIVFNDFNQACRVELSIGES